MTQGFYKNDNGVILYAPNAVMSPDYTLLKEEKDIHEYPIDGWYWFETEEEAYSFFDIVKPVPVINES